MNKLKLFESGIDTRSGLERFNGNQDLYVKWLKNFINDDNFANTKTAIKNKDYKKAFSFAHSLKGVTGNLSMIYLYEEVCLLVESLREESYGSLDEQINQIEVKYKEVISAINNYL